MSAGPNSGDKPNGVIQVMTENQGRVLAVLVLLVALPLAWMKPIDAQADKYVQQGLKQALISFGIARTANAVISVIKESSATANVSVFGVGGSATIALGQVLDPIDDLIESFSSLMLAACISFGIQLALLEVGKSVMLSAALTVVLVGWAIAKGLRCETPLWLAKVLVLLLVARFAVPLAALGSEATYQALLGPKHQSEQASLGATTQRLSAEAKRSGAVNWKDYVDPSVWNAYIDRVKAKTEAWIENAIRVMAVFVVQTVILPLLFLWLVVWLARELFGWQATAPRAWTEAPRGRMSAP